MKRAIIPAALFALGIASLAQAGPARRASAMTLERVVKVMRHGIRPPTSATPAPKG